MMKMRFLILMVSLIIRSGIENSYPAGSTYTSTSAVVRTFDSAGNVNGGLANDLVIKPMQEFMN